MKEILKKIEEAKRILISSHVNPDGDAIGSGIALYIGLSKKYPNKKIDFILQDKVPENLKFLDKTEDVKIYSEEYLQNDYDLALIVDAANIERIGEVINLIKNNCFIINFDHHISNSLFGNINVVKEISSTSELMYNILQSLQIEIDYNMGEAIYTGIVNDTGNFSHDNVTKKTFEIAGNLIELGVDNSKISKDFYRSRTYSGIRILGRAFEKMVFIPEKQFTYFYLPYSELKELDGSKEDTEGLVEEINSLVGSNVSLFLREEENGKIKGSLRSKRNTDVNAIASLFNGGGHRKAAGFTSNLPAEDIIKIIKERL